MKQREERRKRAIEREDRRERRFYDEILDILEAREEISFFL
jgi:hypothetical protein